MYHQNMNKHNRVLSAMLRQKMNKHNSVLSTMYHQKMKSNNHARCHAPFPCVQGFFISQEQCPLSLLLMEQLERLLCNIKKRIDRHFKNLFEL